MLTFLLEPDRHRAAAYDDAREVGELTYVPSDGVWEADHTFVHPDYRGQRLANRLLETVAEGARAAGVKIRPTCPFVVKEMARTEAYADLRIAAAGE